MDLELEASIKRMIEQAIKNERERIINAFKTIKIKYNWDGTLDLDGTFVRLTYQIEQGSE